MSDTYTDLQKREIEKLTTRMKEIHEPTGKNLGPIAFDMVHVLHHDDEMKSVYNKKTVIMGALHSIYVESAHEKHRAQFIRQIKEHEPYIDQQIHQEGFSTKERPSCCRKSFTNCFSS